MEAVCRLGNSVLNRAASAPAGPARQLALVRILRLLSRSRAWPRRGALWGSADSPPVGRSGRGAWRCAGRCPLPGGFRFLFVRKFRSVCVCVCGGAHSIAQKLETGEPVAFAYLGGQSSGFDKACGGVWGPHCPPPGVITAGKFALLWRSRAGSIWMNSRCDSGSCSREGLRLCHVTWWLVQKVELRLTVGTEDGGEGRLEKKPGLPVESRASQGQPAKSRSVALGSAARWEEGRPLEVPLSLMRCSCPHGWRPQRSLWLGSRRRCAPGMPQLLCDIL